MDGRTWALVLAVWAAACISPARTFSTGAPWVLGRTSPALIARAGDRVTAMPLCKLMPLSSAPAAMAAHAGGRGSGRTSLRSAVEPQVGEGGSPAKDLPGEQDPGPAATGEGGSEETGAHFGPVPEIGPSNSLGSSGTPDALLQLRQTFLATRNITVEQLAACFPYELDEFQMDALRGLVQQRSVVVSAPTGSGKTVCGEAAVYLGAAMGKRVLYTTPLKALSNQKFNDFCEQFGSERVGLLTGDVSVNRANASIIVLTTEVYRNMLYDVQDGSVSDVHSVPAISCFHLSPAPRLCSCPHPRFVPPRLAPAACQSRPCLRVRSACRSHRVQAAACDSGARLPRASRLTIGFCATGNPGRVSLHE